MCDLGRELCCRARSGFTVVSITLSSRAQCVSPVFFDAIDERSLGRRERDLMPSVFESSFALCESRGDISTDDPRETRGEVFTNPLWLEDDEPVSPKKGSCLLYTSPSPRDKRQSRMPSSA